MAVHLQKLPLQTFANTVTIYSSGVIIMCPLFLYLFQGNPKQNLPMLLGCLMLVYVSAILKLLFVSGRPVFYSEKLSMDKCICDYGKPSSIATITTGCLLFIYGNVKRRYRLNLKQQRRGKLGITLIAVFIGLSRFYLAAHTLVQVILGMMIGLLVYIFTTNYSESITGTLLGPILKKEKLKQSNPVSVLILMFVLMNYLLHVLFSYRKVYFERRENPFFDFANCFECLMEEKNGFARGIIVRGLVFNIGFGILFGIYLWRKPFYQFKGIFWDGNYRFLIIRIFVLLVVLSPCVWLFLKESETMIRLFLKQTFVSLFVGYLFGNVYLRVCDAITGEGMSGGFDEPKNSSFLVLNC